MAQYTPSHVFNIKKGLIIWSFYILRLLMNVRFTLVINVINSLLLKPSPD